MPKLKKIKKIDRLLKELQGLFLDSIPRHSLGDNCPACSIKNNLLIKEREEVKTDGLR